MRLTLLLILLATTAYSQEYKKFRVGWGIGNGLNWPLYSGAQTKALLLAAEPSYRIRDKIAIGFRLEFGWNGISIASYGLNGQYYLFDSPGRIVRPFIGAGFGFFHPRYYSDANQIQSNLEETRLGFYPRIGFDYKHFFFMLDYNIAPASSATIHDGETHTTFQGKLENTYLSLKIGLWMGGGVKKVKY